MKKLMLAAVALMAAIALSGCIKVNSVTDIKADGSGSAIIEFGVSQSVAEAIEEMQEIDPGNDDMEMPDFEDMDRGYLDKVGKMYGARVTSYEMSDKDGAIGVKIAFDFDNLRAMSAMMGAAVNEDPSDGLGIYDAGDGNYVLKRAYYEFPDFPVQEDDEDEADEPAGESDAEMDPAQMGKQMELMGKLMGAMSELDVRMSITVPGDIIATNAPAREGRTSVWTINSSNMMTAGMDMEPEITFSGKGLKIKDVIAE